MKQYNTPANIVYNVPLTTPSKNTCCVVFTYSIKRACEISKFHVVVVQRRQRNVQNSVMHVQSCCFLI